MRKVIFTVGVPAVLGLLFLKFHTDQVEEARQARDRVNVQRVLHAISLDTAGRYAEVCFLYKDMVRDGVRLGPAEGATFEKDCARAGTSD